MNDTELSAKKFKKSVIYLLLGGAAIFAAVLFFNLSDSILADDANVTNWFIGAAVVALVGWVVLFIGIMGLVKHNPNKD